VANIVQELKKKKLVRYRKINETRIGRKPCVVEFVPSHGSIIGLEIGCGLNGVITTLNGKIITRKFRQKYDGCITLAEILSFIEKLIRNKQSDSHENLVGLGVAIAGYVNDKGEYLVGRFDHSVWMPVKKVLEETFNVPVVVENDANAAMRAEYSFGVARGIQNAVYILKRGAGIGMGLLLNGNIYRGTEGFAGENFELFDGKVLDMPGNKLVLHNDFLEGLYRIAGLLNPEMVILGGELSDVSEHVLTEAEQNLRKYQDKNIKIALKTAKVGKDGAVLGAVDSVMELLFGFPMKIKNFQKI